MPGKLDLSRFGAISDLMRERAKAYTSHELNLNNEITAHDGSHAYGRHGYQSGWEAQFVRCVCQVSPDQTFDPMGLNPSIRIWRNGMLDDTGATAPISETFGALEAFTPQSSDYRTVAGKVSGGFLGPEQQDFARTSALSIAALLNGSDYDGVLYKFKPKPDLTIPLPFTAVCVGVTGKLFGMGYRRTTASPVAVTREFVLACIDGFMNRRTWSQIAPNVAGSDPYYQLIVHNPDFTPFGQIDDLFKFFHVETFPQKAVRVVLRRPYEPTTKQFGPWRIVTMFPDDVITTTGWNPGKPFFSPHLKTRITALKNQMIKGVKKFQQLNFDTKSYAWTGDTVNMAMTRKVRHTIPPWE